MIYEDMHFDQYKKLDALNNSSLKDFDYSPLFYKFKKDNPSESTKAMNFGTMAHKWILERDDFESEYAIVKDEDALLYKSYLDKLPDLNVCMFIDKMNRNTKAYKEIVAQNPDRIILWKEQEEEVCKAHELFNYINKRILLWESDYNDLKTLDLEIKGRNELTVTFEHLGLKCKARFDSIVDDSIYDVKTSANPYNFQLDVNKYKYYMQVGFYWIAYRKTFEKDPKAFNFVVVPSKMPFNDIATHPMDEDYVKWCIGFVEEKMREFKQCKEKNFWPRRMGETIYKPSWRI